ncbi:hypothetical protein NECAME_05220 [Necator americanus]|uniref:Uncharacterized protein n=1 Tax=Necator americanus TaxID=51031 RepID=W2SL88_NECAM|nr:hypothetical protein NECAME_05220 [Necator americanus]ETN69507.1 hypothetical protein NECAME_05220 [Necator americanus]
MMPIRFLSARQIRTAPKLCRKEFASARSRSAMESTETLPVVAFSYRRLFLTLGRDIIKSFIMLPSRFIFA